MCVHHRQTRPNKEDVKDFEQPAAQASFPGDEMVLSAETMNGFKKLNEEKILSSVFVFINARQRSLLQR